MDEIFSLDKFRVPIGNQEIELQEIVFAAGGTPLMRLRIRERSRFTIFDIDPVTAARWGSRMVQWAQERLHEPPPGHSGGESQPDRHGEAALPGDVSP